MTMNPENPYHHEALVAGLAMAIGDFGALCAENDLPVSDDGLTYFCVQILADWKIATKHMESIINAAVCKHLDEVEA